MFLWCSVPEVDHLTYKCFPCFLNLQVSAGLVADFRSVCSCSLSENHWTESHMCENCTFISYRSGFLKIFPCPVCFQSAQALPFRITKHQSNNCTFLSKIIYCFLSHCCKFELCRGICCTLYSIAYYSGYFLIESKQFPWHSCGTRELQGAPDYNCLIESCLVVRSSCSSCLVGSALHLIVWSTGHRQLS